MKRRALVIGGSLVSAWLILAAVRLVLEAARWSLWGEFVDSRVIDVGSGRATIALERVCIMADCTARIRVAPELQLGAAVRTYADTDYRPIHLIVQNDRDGLLVGFCDSYVGGRVGRWSPLAASIEDIEANRHDEAQRLIRSVCRH